MFQELIAEEERGAVAGAQSALQNAFDCVHFGIVFIWSEQCDFGYAIIVTASMMLVSYAWFIINCVWKQTSN